MPVPSYDRFIEPVLACLVGSDEALPTRFVYAHVARTVGLSATDMAELLPSGRQATYKNRIGWAHDRLKRGGYSISVRRGFWQATESGREFMFENPSPWARETSRELAAVSPDSSIGPPLRSGRSLQQRHLFPVEEVGSQLSPDDMISEGIAQLEESVTSALLENILASDPSFFEQLVLDVLFAMGYGASREELEHVGRSSDGGIDGAVSLDKLGLEKVYVQAKRFTDKSVGRPAIQQFIGALHLKQATKGVFFTSSSFTQHARSCARDVQDSLVLIDGPELARLMIKFGVGVTHEILKKPRVDGDYFSDD